MSDAEPTGGQRKGRAVVGAVVLVFVAGYLAYASTLSMGTGEQPGPAVFPIAVGVFLALASAATIVEAWRGSGEDGPVDLPRGRPLIQIGLLLVALVGYVVLLPELGHLITTVLFSVGLLRALSERSWAWVVLCGLAMGIGTHVIFVTLLGVPMPDGILEI